jgi:hypothetical protein
VSPRFGTRLALVDEALAGEMALPRDAPERGELTHHVAALRASWTAVRESPGHPADDMMGHQRAAWFAARAAAVEELYRDLEAAHPVSFDPAALDLAEDLAAVLRRAEHTAIGRKSPKPAHARAMLHILRAAADVFDQLHRHRLEADGSRADARAAKLRFLARLVIDLRSLPMPADLDAWAEARCKQWSGVPLDVGPRRGSLDHHAALR